MQEIRQFQNYQEFKQAFDREARNQAAGFIRMGYLLKVARDTNVLYESGYRSISEFARHEYGLTDDAVSRMIAVNDRYSEGGYSDLAGIQVCNIWKFASVRNADLIR